jgi:hypothetical protein
LLIKNGAFKNRVMLKFNITVAAAEQAEFAVFSRSETSGNKVLKKRSK